MLFRNLAALTAKNVSVMIVVNNAGNGKLEVNVIPTTSSGSTGLNLVAKSFVAYPEELDAEFASVIESFAQTNLTLKEQLDAVKAQADLLAEQAKKDADEKAKVNKAALKKPARYVPPASNPDTVDQIDTDTNKGAVQINMPLFGD